MANAKVQHQEDTSEAGKTLCEPSKKLTTDDFIKRPVSELVKEKSAQWRNEFLVKGAL